MSSGNSKLSAVVMATIMVTSMVVAPVGGETISGGTVPPAVNITGDSPEVVLDNATIDPSSPSSVEVGYNVTGSDPGNVSIGLFNTDTDTRLDGQVGLSSEKGKINLTIPSGISNDFVANATLVDGTTGQEAVDTAGITVESDDTTPPETGNFSVSNPSGQDVGISFESSEQLSTIEVYITGAESASLTETTFDESETSSGTYIYQTLYQGASDGDYTATLETATDSAGNDGAAGQNDTVTVDTSGETDTTPPEVLTVSASGTSNQEIGAFVETDEQLSALNVTIDGPVSTTLSLSNFTEFETSSGTFGYETVVPVPEDGEYTVTVQEATDAAGNDGASGQSDTAIVDTSDGVQISHSEFAAGTSGDGTFVAEDLNVAIDGQFALNTSTELEIANSTGSTVTVTPEESVSDVEELELDFYEQSGSIPPSPTIDVDTPDTKFDTTVNVTVSGDMGIFTAGVTANETERSAPFDSYTVTLVSNGTEVSSTGERLVGIGYRSGEELTQFDDTGEIRFTYPRASLNEGINDSWNAFFELRNGTDSLRVDISDANQGQEFNFTVDTSSLPGGTYSSSIVLNKTGNPGLDNRIINLFGVNDVTINATKDTTPPEVLTVSASGTSNQEIGTFVETDEQLSALNVTIDGPVSTTLSLSDFTEFDTGSGTFGYETVVPVPEDGEYTVTVQEATDAAGNDGANGQSDTAIVDTSDGVQISHSEFAAGTSGDGTFVAEDLNVAIEGQFALNSSTPIEITNSTGSTVTVTPEESIADVEGMDLDPYEPDGSIPQSPTITVTTGDGSRVPVNVTVSGDTGMFAAGVTANETERSAPFDSYGVTLFANGTELDSTGQRLVAIGYRTGEGLNQSGSGDELRFTYPRASLNQGFNSSWHALFLLRNDNDTLRVDVSEANQGQQFNFTVDTSPLANGTYRPALILNETGNPGPDERIVYLFGTDTVTVGPDTKPPEIFDVFASGTPNQEVQVAVQTDEQLANLSVALDGPSIAELSRSDFAETETDGGNFVYEAFVPVSEGGEYTVTLQEATDTAGNDGASGQKTTAVVDTATSGPILQFGADNPGGQDVVVFFETNVQLSELNISLSGPESATLSRSDFQESQTSSGTFIYEGFYPGSSDGNYTVTAESITDVDGQQFSPGIERRVSVESAAASQPDVNVSASSVTPATVTGGDTETFSVTVTVENTSLADDTGELDIRFLEFALANGEEDYTFDYTAANITDGTLTVSGTVTATAPSVAGEFGFPVVVTDLRRNTDSGVESLLSDRGIRFATITVEDSFQREQLQLTANDTSLTRGDSVQFTVTNSTGTPVNATVFLPETSAQTGPDGTVTLPVNAVGTIEAIAAKRATDATEYAPATVELTVESPTIELGSSKLSFDDVALGRNADKQLTLTNNASVPISLDERALPTDRLEPFSISGVPDEIPAGATRSVTVTFEPVERGTVTRTLPAAEDELTLTGTGVAPRIDVQTELPVELSAKTGSSATASVTVANTGNTELNATISTGDERFTHPDTVTVSAGSSESFDLTFTPNADDQGPVTTDLTLTPDSGVVPALSVPAVGTAELRAIELSRSTIGFGNTTVGETETSAVIVENEGTTTETLNATTETAAFSLAAGDSSPFTLDPGEQKRLSVEILADSAGDLSDTLTVENESDSTVSGTATLTATAREPQLAVTTSEPVTFPATPINSTATADVTLANEGTAPLAVSLTDAFSGANADNFAVVGTTEFQIPAGESRNVTLGFVPTAAGGATADLALETNDADASTDTETISLEGTGLEADLTTTKSSVAFGSVGIGDSATETVTLTNEGSDLTIDDVAVTGASGFDAEVSTTDVDSGETVTTTLTFAPQTTGARTGLVQITATGSGGNTTTVTTAVSGFGADGELQLDRTVVRSGVTVPDGTTSGATTLRNVGLSGTSLTVDSLSLADDSQFSISEAGLTEGDTIPQSGGRVVAAFNPAASADNGEVVTELTAEVSGAERTFTRTIPVIGVVSAPEPTVSTATVDTGTVEVGSQISRTVTLSNEGGEPYTISDVSSAAPEAVSAQLVGPSEIVPGDETTVLVAVNRSTPGSFDTGLTVTTEAAGGIAVDDPTITVTGDAVAPELSVASTDVSFAETAVGSADRQSVEIQNTGNATLELKRPAITGDGTDAFSVLTGDRRLSIGPGSSQTISLGFEPSDAVDVTGSLTIAPRGGQPTVSGQTLSLAGTGVTADATLNNSAVSFDDTGRDETRTRSLRLTNDGSAPLEVTGSSITGESSSAFTLDGLGRPILGPGEDTTFEVTVNTTGADRGDLTGRLDISTNDTTVTSYLSATVTEPDIDLGGPVASSSFGTTRLGTTSLTTVEVSNTGNADLDLTDISVVGSDEAAFRVVDAPSTITPEESDQVTIEFDPLGLSNAVSRAQNTPLDASATLSVASNDPDSGDGSVTTELNGEATTAALSATRTFQFGDTPIGETSTGQLTVENTPSATAPLNLTDLRIGGPDSDAFAAALNGTDTPATLAPGESATVDLSITPESLGQKFATLSVATDDTRQPVRKVGLSNTETVYSVQYGSIHVDYINPTEGVEPTVDVDEGLRGRNATLRTVNSNVDTESDYSLDYTFGASADEVGGTDLDRSDTAGVRYINATTSAAPEDFVESTFEIEVSKAALAAQDATPQNVTIYHDAEGDGSYTALDSTELLFETTQGYVYEVTTDSYSVFAVGVESQTEPSLESISLSLDSTTIDDGSTTDATVTAQYDDGSTADITENATLTSTDTNVATVSGSTITGEAGGTTTIQASYTDETTETDTVSLTVDETTDGDDGTDDDQTDDGDDTPDGDDGTDDDQTDDGDDNTPDDDGTDDDEETPGDEPPAEPRPEEIPASELGDFVEVPDSATPTRAERVRTVVDEANGTSTANFSANAAVDSISIESAVSDNITVAEYDQEPETTGPSPGRSVSVTQISVPEQATESAATITMRVPVDRLAELDVEADDLRVNRFADGGWQRLDTQIRETTESHVFLTARTPGFSFFSVSAVSQPEAAFEVSPAEPVTGTDVELDASTSTDQYGEITGYEWLIDGETVTGETVTTTFESAGEYEIELTVENDAGETATTSRVVTVTQESSDDGTDGTDDGSDGTDDGTDGTDDDGTDDGTDGTDDGGDGDDGSDGEDSDDGGDGDDGFGPGFGVLVALLAFLGVAMLIRRRG